MIYVILRWSHNLNEIDYICSSIGIIKNLREHEGMLEGFKSVTLFGLYMHGAL